MRFEILIQFIVPLTFLAIWALTTLLNRDAQPLPPRPGMPQGPRPGMPPARPVDRRPAATEPAGFSRLPERATSRGMPPASSFPSRTPAAERPPLDMDDAIVYIESGPRPGTVSRGGPTRPSSPGSSPTGGRPSRGSARRGRSRSAESGAGSQGRGESQPKRALSDQMSESMGQLRAKPLEIAPLGAPMKRLSQPLTQASAAPQTNQDVDRALHPSLAAGELRKLISSPRRLREAFVLNEILMPPVSLRRPR